jgi:hypothetical protein
MPELNLSVQRSLTRYFTGDFASWTVHLVNICVKNQQIHQLLIQFINYVRWLLRVSALHCHPQGAFLVPSEMFNRGAVDRILWMGVLCLSTFIRAFSPVVRQMPWNDSQRQGTARTTLFLYISTYIWLKSNEMQAGILCILYFTVLVLALHVSGAICTHHQKHKLQSAAVGTRDFYYVLEVPRCTEIWT